MPRLLSGQSAIIATGSIAYPPEWAHASPDRLQAARRLEGDDDDLDLRPPGDPGGRVGRLPAPDRAAAAGRGRLLRVGRRRPRDRRRPRSPPPTRPPPRRRRSAAPPPREPTAAPGEVDEELLQAVQAATSLLKGYRTHGHLAARLDPLGSRAEGRPGDPAREPQPDAGADGPDPGLDPAHRRPRRDPARGAAADARGLLRHDRLPVRAPLLAPAADLAAGDDRDRRPPPAARRRRETAPAAAPDRRLRVRALPREGLPGPEDLLDRGPRRDRADARRAGHPRAAAPAPRRSSSGWPTAAASASSPTTSAARSSRSWPSSRAPSRSSAVKAVAAIPHGGTGDVKYHYGHRGVYETHEGEKIAVRLYPNPSHLEFVDPVVTGGARFLQSELRGPEARRTTRSARCRSCSTATPPSPARASSPRRSTCRR